jgi:hypothetical protein
MGNKEETGNKRDLETEYKRHLLETKSLQMKKMIQMLNKR